MTPGRWLRTVGGFAVLALVAVGLDVGGGVTAAHAAGVFAVPGTITSFAPPSYVATQPFATGGQQVGIEAIGGAGQSVDLNSTKRAGSHGARLYGVFPFASGRRFALEVGRYGGAGGSGQNSGGTPGGAGGGYSSVGPCSVTGACQTGLFAGGGGGSGGPIPDRTTPPIMGAAGAGGAAGQANPPVAMTDGVTCIPATAAGDGGDAATTNNDQSGTGGKGGACILTKNTQGNYQGAAGGSGPNGGKRAPVDSTTGAGHNGGDGGASTTSTSGGGGGGGAGFRGGGGGGDGFNGGGGGGGAGSSAYGRAYSATEPLGYLGPAPSVSTASSASPSVKFFYIPGPVQNLSATGGNHQVSLQWTPPADQGGALTVSSYTITWTPADGPVQPQTVTCPCTSPVTKTITALNNDTTYTFTVVAHNDMGDGPPVSISGKPLGVPSAPQNLTAIPGNQRATISWNEPADLGCAMCTITAYAVRSTNASGQPDGVFVRDVEGSVHSVTFTGLTNGQTYYFTVQAFNGNGGGGIAGPVSVTPNVGPPGAPTLSGTPGNGQANLSWTPPADNGGSAIDRYTVNSVSPGPTGHSVTVNCSTGFPNPCASNPMTATVGGLANNVTYYFVVFAHNANGNGPNSNTVAITPGADVPGAPTSVVASAGDGSAMVTWGPPASDGGSPITGYKVAICQTQPMAQPCSPVTGSPFGPNAVSASQNGLTNGNTYIFTVTAVNGAGDGGTAQSNTVMPTGTGGGVGTSIYSQSWDAIDAAGWKGQSAPSNSSTPFWHLTSSCSANHTAGGGFAWYYGNGGCNYNNGTTNSGRLYSPNFGLTSSDPIGNDFNIPKNTAFHVNLFGKRKVESCSSCSHDQTVIHVNYNDGTGWHRIFYADSHISGGAMPNDGAYHPLSFTVTSPTGQLQVRFTFNTVSSASNGFYGWSIDDFAITN